MDYLEFSPSRVSVHFVDQKFSPFGEVSRPLGCLSTLWTCYKFYLLEGPSTLWTKIFEPLVGLSTFVELIEFSHSGALSTLGLGSFSPSRRFVHSVD